MQPQKLQLQQTIMQHRWKCRLRGSERRWKGRQNNDEVTEGTEEEGAEGEKEKEEEEIVDEAVGDKVQSAAVAVVIVIDHGSYLIWLAYGHFHL
jgi:preprotein translocase subunit SecF